MPFAHLPDVKLYYEIYGSEYELLESSVRQKPTIVAVHGGPGVDHNLYDVPFLATAAEYAQVIFYDQRGHGKSSYSNSSNWNLKQWATDLYQFCEVLGLEKPFIHGVSMGGWVVQSYASLFPDQAKGIILHDTEAYYDIPAIIEAFGHKGGKELREIADTYFHHPSPTSMQDFFGKCIPACSNNPMPAEWMNRTISTPEVNDHFKTNELTHFNLYDELKKIKAPVLYLSNTTNPLHLYASAKKTAEAITNTTVEFVAFENCGLIAMDAKEKGLAKIKEFVLKHFNS